ncbi:DinB family protein [Yeosuana marina]|uniref:DinB family protein n=1 Tax=Yeosuana marina TaxID=1565536 RepID=UPI0030C7EA4D
MVIQDIQTEEYATFYSGYINKILKNTVLIEGFETGFNTVSSFFRAIPNDKLNYKYAPDKWTIKEVFQHIIDTERVFMYRCFRIARHDRTPLAGFEQNDYIQPSNANQKTIEQLLEEYHITRQSFIVLLKSLSDIDLKQMGNASGNDMSARAAAFIVLGHELWHLDIINERYL